MLVRVGLRLETNFCDFLKMRLILNFHPFSGFPIEIDGVGVRPRLDREVNILKTVTTLRVHHFSHTVFVLTKRFDY